MFIGFYLFKNKIADVYLFIFSLLLRFSFLWHTRTQKSIDTFSTAELYELLDIRPYNKISKSNLREQSYDLLRRHYLATKPKITAILAKRQ